MTVSALPDDALHAHPSDVATPITDAIQAAAGELEGGLGDAHIVYVVPSEAAPAHGNEVRETVDALLSRGLAPCFESSLATSTGSGEPVTASPHPDVTVSIENLANAGVRKIILAPVELPLAEHRERLPVDGDVLKRAASQGVRVVHAATASSERRTALPTRPQVGRTDLSESMNTATNYTMYAVFRARAGVVAGAGSDSEGPETGAELAAQLDRIESLTVRGWYDVSGFRADADVMLWCHAPDTAALQLAFGAVRSAFGGGLEPVWSTIGVHRAAEFNRAHVPAFLAGENPKSFLCVYPFVRGADWYLLPDSERREHLRAHGAAARDYGDVLANTVACFGLNDYEWLLAFEADDLTRIVDLMRELRATEARRHVREETPFFTGPRTDASTLFARLFHSSGLELRA